MTGGVIVCCDSDLVEVPATPHQMVERFPTCNPRHAAANEAAWLALGAPGLSFQDRGVGRLQNSRHLEAVFWIRVILVLAGWRLGRLQKSRHPRSISEIALQRSP